MSYVLGLKCKECGHRAPCGRGRRLAQIVTVSVKLDNANSARSLAEFRGRFGRLRDTTTRTGDRFAQATPGMVESAR